MFPPEKPKKFLICCQDQTLDIQKKSFTLTTFKMYISKGQISSVGLVCLLGYLNFLVGLVNNKHIS